MNDKEKIRLAGVLLGLSDKNVGSAVKCFITGGDPSKLGVSAREAFVIFSRFVSEG